MVFGLRLGQGKRGQESSPKAEQLPAAEAKKPIGPGVSKSTSLTVNEFVARTKKCREKGLEPTKPELIAYARYLGIDPINDGDLMWIADEALSAPLPAEWTEHHDSAERVFYYNVQTAASSWTHPLEQLHRDTYKSIVQFRNGGQSKEDQARELENWRRRCEDSEREAHKELQAWTEHVDDQGTKFYYNSALQRSVWTDPRPARCHTLYLQMKALRALSRAAGHPSWQRHEDGGSGAEDRAHQPDRMPIPTSPDAFHHSFGKSNGWRNMKAERTGNSDPESIFNSTDASIVFVDKEARRGKKKRGKAGKGFGAISDDEDDHRSGANDDAGLPLIGQKQSSLLTSASADGLSNVGRTKIRAGIKLEPLA